MPRHANNSQIIQEVVKGVPTQTEATPDPRTGQKSGFSFPVLICHHGDIKNSPLSETMYRAYFFPPYFESSSFTAARILSSFKRHLAILI